MDPNTPAQTPPPPPPAGWAAPPPPPPPAGWAAPPAAPARSPLLRIGLGILALVLVAGGVFAVRTLTDGPAKIEFTTTLPPDDFKCKISDKVTSVSAGTPVWMVIHFRNTMDDSRIDVTVTKDGEAFDTFYYDEASGYDCVAEINSLEDLDPGTYKFKATIGDKTEAEGTLTITE